MTDPLIPPEAFAPIEAELARRIRESGEVGFSPDDPRFGEALARAVLFDRYDDLVQRVAAGISDIARFYNRYYWARRFAVKAQEALGADASLEQWVFKVLEAGEALELDWSVVEELDRRARGR